MGLRVGPEIYFCNGILNTEAEASRTRDHISDLLNGQPVQLHHNDSTSTLDILSVALPAIIGAASIGMGLHGMTKSKDRERAIMLLGLGMLAVLVAYETYESEIDARIDELARTFADKVTQDLNAKPNGRALLVLHSQGAEVGKRALQRLDASLKGRVDVIAIGGKEKIPTDMAGRVFNIRHERDLVPIFFNRIVDQTRKQPGDVVLSGGDCLLCHDASEYLKRGQVQSVLKGLATV